MTRAPVQIVNLVGWLAAAGSLLATPPTFLSRRDYAASGTIAFAVADANGDHIPDIIWVGSSGRQEITTLLGSGKGTFRQGPTSQVGIIMNYVLPVAADLNGDGKTDIITSGGEAGLSGIGVCFGNGDGTFQPAVFSTTPTPSFLGNVVLGDFNGDGILDAMVAGETGVWLFTGTGTGAFHTAVLTPVPNSNDGQIVAADFNGDGKLDVAVITSTGFAVLFGNGDGTFQTPQAYTVSNVRPEWIAAGDLNLDHHPDIVLAAYPAVPPVPDYVRVYLNNGTGGFSSPTPAELSPVEQIAIADVNGDGIPDLIGSNGGVALGRGNGTFQPATYYPLPPAYTATFVVPADLRHNGRTDLVFEESNGTISVLLNFGNGRLEDGESIPVTGGAGCGAAADYNGDGKPDLAVNTPNGVSILLGTGEPFPAFRPGASIALPYADCLVTGDLNNDGIPDLLVPSNGTVVAYLGNGDGTFTQASVTSTPNGGYLALGDFNQDGNLDFAITTASGFNPSSNLLAYGNGDGTFQTPVPIIKSPPPAGGYTNIAAGDLNHDGWPDLVITSEYESYVYVLLNNHQGGFSVSNFHAMNCSPDQVLLADLDGDGELDIVLADYSTDSAVIYLGNGKGGFTYRTELAGSVLDIETTSWAAVGDISGDGIADIVLTAGSTLDVFLGNGDGTFQTPFYIGAGPYPGSLLLENLHGQPSGFPDIVAPDLTGGVTVLINATNRVQ